MPVPTKHPLCARLSLLVNDALAVLAELTGGDAPECKNAAADALGLLALVADQDVEPAQGSDGTDGTTTVWRFGPCAAASGLAGCS